MNTPSQLSGLRQHLFRRGFTLQEEIGTGYFGSVYRAIQNSLGRPAAVKILTGLAGRTPTDRKRFEREAPLLAKVQHPNIPYVITNGTVSGDPYFIMQYIEGDDLSKIITQNRRLDFDHTGQIIRDILAALDVVHHANIVHRDIKPDNIIVSPYGAYLVDFSIGFCREYEPGLSRATVPQTALGVPDYASPEQQSDAQSVDGRTDIYSVGVVMYEMLTGHPRIPKGDFAFDLPPSCPARLASILEKACAPSPADRHSSARDFLADLEKIIAPSLLMSNTPTKAVAAMCPTPGCEQGKWSPRGYFRGPEVMLDTSDLHCSSCGGRLIRECPSCEHPLSPDIENLVTTSTKSGGDNTKAHCGKCGAKVFATPTCANCGSLVHKDDFVDFVTYGTCGKCIGDTVSGYISYEPVGDLSSEDEDLPF